MAGSADTAAVLSNVSLFKNADDKAKIDILKQMRRTKFASGEVVVQHMDADDDVYFVLSGSLIATIISPEGREVAFDVMTSGDYFGEIAAIDGGSRSASVSALTQAEVGMLSGSSFRSVIAGNPEVNGALIVDLIGRIRRLTERNYENIALRIKHRVQLELLRLGRRENVLHAGGGITPIPTHAQIAARIGANREAVTREISSLSKKGFIKAGRQSLTFIDPDGLVEEAGADIDWEPAEAN